MRSLVVFLSIFVVALVGVFLYGVPASHIASVATFQEQFLDPCEYHSYPIAPPSGPLPPPRPIPNEGLEKYRNELYRFSIFYPADFVLEEFSEIGGAMTVVFQNRETLEGFQIFVVPYKSSGIVARRIDKDVAGVVMDRATTTVAGICASAFKSSHPLLGPTNEVWIPKDGYLFELTTYEGQEDLLQSIVDSWRFL